MNCTKAIIAVAGFGTRRLPISKAIEKCMLPLLNRPVVDYAVQDCIGAGITDIYFVVSGDARQLRDYYERQPVLESYLMRKHKPELIEAITPPEDVRFHYVSQDLEDGRYGTSIPVWLCRDYIEQGEHVLVIMGDQTFYRVDGLSEAAQLMRITQEQATEGCIMGNPIPWEQIHRFGIIKVDEGNHYRTIIEHPTPDQVNTNLNNSSFYLLPSTIFSYIEQQLKSGTTVNGEYYIIDALNSFVSDGNKLSVYQTESEYLECGSLDNWVHSNSWLLEHGR